MITIEARYQIEDSFLEAVERGDYDQAVICMNEFGGLKLDQWNSDFLENTKKFFIALNTLLRKTVQKAEVHPTHIHKISQQMIDEIENIKTIEDVINFGKDMLKSYCRLVTNHSLQEYSLPVRKAVNYIDFNFTEQLSLEQISNVASVSYSYLSSQFCKETGNTVVDYINQKRMKKALGLLSTTKLPINKISEICGFYDYSYFSKMFKRNHGKSPREFRKNIKS